MEIAVPDFKDIVPYLDHPLALVGYGLCLLFALFGAVIKAGAGKSNAATKSFLLRISLLGSGIVLLVVIGGFAVHAMELAAERNDAGARFVAAAKADADIATASLPLGDAKIAREQVDEAIALLQRWRAHADAPLRAAIDRAIQDLGRGDAGAAVQLLSQRLNNVTVGREPAAGQPGDRREAIAVARALGGLTFLTDTQRAFQAYSLLVELAPEDWVAWYQLALVEIRRGNYRAATIAAQHVRDIGRKAQDKAVIARSLSLLGVIARQKSENLEAVSLSEEAVELLRASKDRRGLAIELGNLGILKRLLGDYQASEKLHKEALAIEKELDDTLGVAREYGNLGSLLLVRGRKYHEQAEAYIELSLQYNRRAGSRVGEAIRLNQLGAIVMRRREWEKAEASFKEALEITRSLDDVYGQAVVLSNLGRVNKFRAQIENRPDLYEKAEALYNEAMDIQRSLGNRVGEAVVHARLGRLYFRWGRDGDIERAKEHLEAAITMSRGTKHRAARVDYLRSYGQVLQALRSRDEACAAWREALSLQDDLGLGAEEGEWFQKKLQEAGCEA